MSFDDIYSLGNICCPLIGLESSLDEVFVIDEQKVQEITQGNPQELQHIKKFFKGSSIHRYDIDTESDKYILYLHEQIKDIEQLEGIWKYLCENEVAIKGRKTSNLAPTIYLEGYFNDYNCGEPMSDICQRILKVYEENKVSDNFDVSMVTDFICARNRICCKLINAERNAELLADAQHVIIEDLAVIFFILATRDEFGTGTITIRNNILDMWDITVDQLYKLALENTQRLFRGRVTSMLNVMTEILADKLDAESCREFFDMMGDDMTVNDILIL